MTCDKQWPDTCCVPEVPATTSIYIVLTLRLLEMSPLIREMNQVSWQSGVSIAKSQVQQIDKVRWWHLRCFA
jgi:hypothetical protein